MLDYFRKLYKDSNEETKKRICEVVEIWKKNKKFGGQEGHNGLCYTCYLNEARKGHWNCKECSGIPRKVRGVKKDMHEIHEGLWEMRMKAMGKEESQLEKDKKLQKTVENVFFR